MPFIRPIPLESTSATLLEKLDDFNLLSILDFMDFASLINLSFTSERLHALIEKHVLLPRWRIHERQIVFEGRRSEPIDVTELKLDEEHIINRFLQYYGEYITDLRLSHARFQNDQMQRISQQVAKYCSKSLQKIELMYLGQHFLPDASKTFPKVTDVMIRSNSWKNNQIHQIFPSMERLKIDARVLYGMSEENTDLGSAKNLHSIDIVGPSLSSFILQYIKRNVPNLETLTFRYEFTDYYMADGEIVQFDNIKNLVIRSYFDTNVIQTPFRFPKLESLEIDSQDHCVANVLERSTNLKKLHLSNEYVANNLPQILWIVSRFPNFNEITLNWSDYIRAPVLVGLFNDVAGLERATVYTKAEENRGLLMDALSRFPQWQVERNWDEIRFPYNSEMYYCLSFTRKNE